MAADWIDEPSSGDGRDAVISPRIAGCIDRLRLSDGPCCRLSFIHSVIGMRSCQTGDGEDEHPGIPRARDAAILIVDQAVMFR